jgi:flagellar basal-body rod protein FlgF
MDPIAVSAAAGMRARMESLDLLANNLANASTNGFKNDSEFYTLFSSEAASSGARLPMIKNQWTDFSQGLVQPTNEPLDFALSGRGFFAVQGPSGPLYTRNGNFRLSRAGVLENSEGYAVRAVDGKPLQSQSPEPFDVSADGTVRQGGQVVGQIELVDFSDSAVLVKQGNNYFRNADPKIKARPALSVEVQQGRIENSNVSTADSAVRLVTVMRQFEMLQKAVTLAGEMDRKSVEEVARVNT